MTTAAFSPAPDRPTWQLSENREPPGLVFDAVLVWLFSFAGLMTLIAWYDNAQGITGNGIYKAIQLKPWIRTPGSASLDPSNYLYFPVIGQLCALLDFFGIQPGDPRRQMPIIHAASAAACMSIIYVLIRQLTCDRAIAWLATLFHLSGAFFLNLAISNEDIMPSYTLMLLAMSLGAVWFTKPTPGRIIIVSSIFTFAWLFEWRLLFPALPAMLLALALAPGKLATHCGRIAVFLLTSFAVSAIVYLLWGNHPGNPYKFTDLIWTAKGIETGWAGFSVAKIWLLWAGIGESLLGGRNDADPGMIPVYIRELLTGTALIIALAAGALLLFWRNRTFPQSWTLLSIFGGAFAAGELMNVYSQPQDPQMQINVMPWLTIAAALIAATLVQARRRLALVGLGTLSAAILMYNVSALTISRGEDTRWQKAIERIEAHVPLERSFLLVHGFGVFVSQAIYHWDGDASFFETLGPAPTPGTKYKVLSLTNGPVMHPGMSGPQLAAELEGQIRRAMSLGYEVIAVDIWSWSRAKVGSSLSSVADFTKAVALYDMLHTRFTGTPVYDDPAAGAFVRLTPVAAHR